MKVTVAKSHFNFTFFSIGIYLLLVTFLVLLGLWQLGRADEKKLFLEKQAFSANKQLVDLNAIIKHDPEQIRYRNITVEGVYDLEQQYLIDNQIVNGRAGYFVMTPLKIKNSDQSVLINRGWVALNKDRRILPEVSITKLNTAITGRINHFPVVGIRLEGAEIPTESWPSVVQVVDSGVLSQKLGYALLPFQIELAASMNDGYARDWKKNTIMSPEKHIAYAVQWFGLAITLTLLFLWFSSKKD
mgnify:CR=1 FL=1